MAEAMDLRSLRAGLGGFATVAALAACGSLPGAAAPEPAAREGAASGSSELRLGELSPRELASGRCGLFLWTRTQPPSFVFFADPETGRAAVVLDGRELALRRLSVDGPAAAGRPGAQTFATASGDVSVRLTVQGTEQVENGYRVTGASLRVTNAVGWSGLVATAGLAACQP
jgi:hypothetical protein